MSRPRSNSFNGKEIISHPFLEAAALALSRSKGKSNEQKIDDKQPVLFTTNCKVAGLDGKTTKKDYFLVISPSCFLLYRKSKKSDLPHHRTVFFISNILNLSYKTMDREIGLFFNSTNIMVTPLNNSSPYLLSGSNLSLEFMDEDTLKMAFSAFRKAGVKTFHSSTPLISVDVVREALFRFIDMLEKSGWTSKSAKWNQLTLLVKEAIETELSYHEQLSALWQQLKQVEILIVCHGAQIELGGLAADGVESSFYEAFEFMEKIEKAKENEPKCVDTLSNRVLQYINERISEIVEVPDDDRAKLVHLLHTLRKVAGYCLDFETAACVRMHQATTAWNRLSNAGKEPFRAFVQKLGRFYNNRPIDSLTIVPLQRATKRHVFVETFLKTLNESDDNMFLPAHIDVLISMRDSLKKHCDSINEEVQNDQLNINRIANQMQGVKNIEETGRICKYIVGAQKVNQANGADCSLPGKLYLFNDCLVFATMSENKAKEQIIIYETTYSLKRSDLSLVPDGNNLKIVNSENNFLFVENTKLEVAKDEFALMNESEADKVKIILKEIYGNISNVPSMALPERKSTKLSAISRLSPSLRGKSPANTMRGFGSPSLSNKGMPPSTPSAMFRGSSPSISGRGAASPRTNAIFQKQTSSFASMKISMETPKREESSSNDDFKATQRLSLTKSISRTFASSPPYRAPSPTPPSPRQTPGKSLINGNRPPSPRMDQKKPAPPTQKAFINPSKKFSEENKVFNS